MKKLLLSALCVLSAMASMADTQTYTEDLVVDVNGTVTDPTPANVQVEVKGDKIDFTLNNLYLPGDPDKMPVGNISLTDIPATVGEDGIVNFSITTNVVLTEGTDPSVEWMGPMITMLCGGQVPLTMTGKFNSSRLYVHIDLDLTAQMGQVIKVDLGEESNVTAEQTAGQPAGIYIRGSLNGWSADDTYQFVTTSTEGVYELRDVTLRNGADGFKVADATWSDACNFGGNGAPIAFGTPYTLVAGGSNIKLPTDNEYNISLITFDANAGTLLVVGEEGEKKAIEVNTLAIPGSFNEWNPEAEPMSLDNASNTWTGSVTLAAGTAYSFKFAANRTWDVNYGATEAANNAANAETYTAKLGGENIFFDMPQNGTALFTLTLNEWNDGGTYSVTTEAEGVKTVLASGTINRCYGLDGRKAQQGILIQNGQKILK